MANSNHKGKRKIIIVFDTSAICVLSRINLLSKTVAYREKTSAELILPSEVYNELKRWREFPEIEKSLKQCFRITSPDRAVEEEIEKRRRGLGPGEISVIATAMSIVKENNDNVAIITIIDDKKGRKVARDFDLETHGSLWMIIQLKRHNIITRGEAVYAIKALPQHGFYISEEDLQAAVREAERDC